MPRPRTWRTWGYDAGGDSSAPRRGSPTAHRGRAHAMPQGHHRGATGQRAGAERRAVAPLGIADEMASVHIVRPIGNPLARPLRSPGCREPRLRRSPRASCAESGLDLVGDEQGAACGGDVPGGLEVFRRRGPDAALALDRLEQDGRGLVVNSGLERGNVVEGDVGGRWASGSNGARYFWSAVAAKAPRVRP